MLCCSGRRIALGRIPSQDPYSRAVDPVARILVTDGEQRSSLAVVRSLGRAGHHVMVASAMGKPLAGVSRFCRSSSLVPDPGARPAAFRDEIQRLVDEEDIEVLLPMTDVSAALLLELRATRPRLVIPFPTRGVYEEVSNKRRLMEVASELGIPVPSQVVIPSAAHDRREIEDWVRQEGFSVVLKPARSAVPTKDGVVKFGVTIVSSSNEFRAGLDSYPAQAYPLLVQRRIDGAGVGAFLLTRGGCTLASFGHRRLREKPPTGGVSVYRESVELRDDVRNYAERLLGHFGWTGAAMVEFKEDAATGTPYLMEVNGRLWGSLQLAIDAGVDFPELLVRGALGEDVTPVSQYRLGVRSRWLWGEVDHLLWILRAPRGYRRDNPRLPSRLRAVANCAIPWRPGDRLEVLRFGDLKPFLRETEVWFRSLGRGPSRSRR